MSYALETTVEDISDEDSSKMNHDRFQPPKMQMKTNSFHENLYYDVVFKNSIPDNLTHLKEYVCKCLGDHSRKKCGIIFCRTIESAQHVAIGLTRQGVVTVPYHEGLSTHDRIKIQNEWLTGVFPVIATDRLDEEMNKSSIRFVVHFDLPLSIAAYYQESGRAGRDGLSSYCRIYYCKEAVKTTELILKSEIANSNDNNVEKAKRNYADFLKMGEYCETIACRHKLFSNYFGDVPLPCKNRCDVCKNPKEAQDALDNFLQLSYNFFLEPVQYEDESDLNGGNYYSQHGSNQNETETKSFIQQQLKKLNSQLQFAKETEMSKSAHTAKVISAQNTENSISGLTIRVRQSYLSMLVDLLKDNYKVSSKDGLLDFLQEHYSITGLQHLDFEECGKNIEFKCFRKSKSKRQANRAYIQRMAKEITKLRKFNSNAEISSLLQNHVPIKHQAKIAKKRVNNKERRRKMNATLIGSFLQLYHESSPPPSTETSKISFSSDLSSTQVKIDEQPHSNHKSDSQNCISSGTFNDLSVKLEPTNWKTQPPGNISPTNTIIKEEEGDINSHISNEFFEIRNYFQEMLVQPITVIKDEYDELNNANQPTDDNINPAGFLIDDETLLRNKRLRSIRQPSRSISPEETFVKNENVQRTFPGVDLSLPLTNSIISKQPVSQRDPISRAKEKIKNSKHPRIDWDVSPTETIIKRELSPQPDPNPTTSTFNATFRMSSSFRKPNYGTGNVSPTNTIIKDEPASPTMETDFSYSTERKENLSENYFASQPSSPEHLIKNKRSPERLWSQNTERHLVHESFPTSSSSESKSRRKYERTYAKREKMDINSNEDSTKIKSNDRYKSPQVQEQEADAQAHVLKNAINVTKLTQTRDRSEHSLHGNIKQIEIEFQGQVMPPHLLKLVKKEKSIIAELVKKWLMPHYKDEKIQPKNLFRVVARAISHIFYDRFADESIIKTYIDDLFQKVGKITSARDIESIN